jgi:uncharacterized membrane protein YdbT with pleckstrin-like domain
MNSEAVYVAHPAMFRAHPFYFILCVLLIPVFGLGILVLLGWYIHCKMTRLTVTPTDLLYERGILSKDRMGMALKHIRSIRVTQSFINRILGVGRIEIFTAGDVPEFAAYDLPDPHAVREAIRRAQDRTGTA